MAYLEAVDKYPYDQKFCPICKENNFDGHVYCCTKCWRAYKKQCRHYNIDYGDIIDWAHKNKIFIVTKLDLMQYKLSL